MADLVMNHVRVEGAVMADSDKEVFLDLGSSHGYKTRYYI
jgi:hypothetical protein